MTERLRVTDLVSGLSLTADFLYDEAPHVCEIVSSMLPVEGDAIHGQYSGPEIFLLLDGPTPPPENEIYRPLPGELFYSYEPPSVGTDNQAKVEIALVYDRGASFGGAEAIPVPASLFARVPGDWTTALASFAEACRGIRRGHPMRLRIETIEDGTDAS